MFKQQAEQLARLQKRVDEQARFWQAVGKPVRKRGPGTTYFSDRGTLVDMLEKLFNMDELEDVCFEIGVNWEMLPGGKRRKARGLIEHLERRAQIYKLLDVCKERRPHVEWPSL